MNFVLLHSEPDFKPDAEPFAVLEQTESIDEKAVCRRKDKDILCGPERQYLEIFATKQSDASVCTEMCNVIENSHPSHSHCATDGNNTDDSDDVKTSPEPKKKQRLFGKLKSFVQKHTQRENVPYKNFDLTEFSS